MRIIEHLSAGSVERRAGPDARCYQECQRQGELRLCWLFEVYRLFSISKSSHENMPVRENLKLPPKRTSWRQIFPISVSNFDFSGSHFLYFSSNFKLSIR